MHKRPAALTPVDDQGGCYSPNRATTQPQRSDVWGKIFAVNAMKICARLSVLLLAISFCFGAAYAADDNLKASTDAAQKWLALVDAGKYAESWDQSSSLFKEKITKEKWEQALNQVRSPLGKVESRQFKAAQFQTDVPNAPPGKYMIIQYQTKFSNGDPTIETITPMVDKDGTWRVSGYYIKPEVN